MNDAERFVWRWVKLAWYGKQQAVLVAFRIAYCQFIVGTVGVVGYAILPLIAAWWLLVDLVTVEKAVKP